MVEVLDGEGKVQESVAMEIQNSQVAQSTHLVRDLEAEQGEIVLMLLLLHTIHIEVVCHCN